MNALNQTTRRRLLRLPQIASVWEGDRRALTQGAYNTSPEWNGEKDISNGNCILWVDGSQGVVRAMDVVPPDAGPETVVRTLLRAMEQPHSPSLPARPQKIVVSDRELLFFLRGVLQGLDITLDYVPDLPLIDEIFRGFEDAIHNRLPQLPEAYITTLPAKAMEIWELAPWQFLEDHQILAIELNQWDIDTLYISIMGKLGMEYGVLLYRSLDSLQRFRQQALAADESTEAMEEAFLGQDCLFVTFDAISEEESVINPALLPTSAIAPSFGSLHPLEGMRASLCEEEASAMQFSLEALARFLRQNSAKFANGAFPELTSRFRISVSAEIASEDSKPKSLPVKVSTLPELAAEMLSIGESEAFDMGGMPIIRDDLVPENSFLSLGMVPWETLSMVRLGAEYCQIQEAIAEAGDGLPVIMIQTSRPKAKALIEDLKNAGGLQAICFNPGEDPHGGDRYDLGLLQAGSGEFYLFGEFSENDPTHAAARKKWDQRCKKTKGYCGLIIAKGLTGASRGNPKLSDMMGLFEAQALSANKLGLGTLQLSLAVDWL
jgi:hypothetical protein